ncbi:Fucoxanthin-chlorophyll a-c binding protein A, chloroplastic, partial [Symbiodinium microadriaticum]
DGFRTLRAAEIKHGRVAMMAALGAVVQHYVKFPGFDSVPSGLAASITAPGSYGFVALFAVAGILELGAWTESAEKEPGNFGDPAGLGQYTQAMSYLHKKSQREDAKELHLRQIVGVTKENLERRRWGGTLRRLNVSAEDLLSCCLTGNSSLNFRECPEFAFTDQAGLLAGEAVRVGELTGQEKVNGSAVEQKAGTLSFGRAVETVVAQRGLWSELTIVKKLGEGSFGKVFLCQVKCDPSQYVTVKLIAEKSHMVLREINILEAMQGVSEYCIASIGNPTYLDTPEGYWIKMPLMNHGELWDLIVKCSKQPNCGTLTWPRKAWNWVNPMYNEAFMLLLFHDIVSGVQVCQMNDAKDCGWQGTPLS